MKYLTFLVVLVAAAIAAVYTAPLPTVGEIGLNTTSSHDRPWFLDIPSFIESFSSILLVQDTVTIFKRQDEAPGNDTSDNDPSEDEKSTKAANPVLLAVIFISFALELIVLTGAVALCMYSCVRKWRKRQLERNPEQQRAQQLLESRRQSAAIELDVLQPRSTAQLPLTDNIETPAATHQTLAFYESDSDHAGPSTPARQGMHDSHTQTEEPEVITMNEGAQRQGIQSVSETSIPEIFVTINETTPESSPHSNGSTPGVRTSGTQTGRFSTDSGAGNQTSHPACCTPLSSATDSNSDEGSDVEGPFLTSAVYQPPENTTARSQSSTPASYSTTSTVRESRTYDADAVEINAQNGIITRDWAYHDA
ncbi:hypothetical protein GGR51DRAFT_560912 [Nemania sp. FL0031]|nr:hypothetical protein GGR51DRAFT_560912 [Nemania sp. FL0031]